MKQICIFFCVILFQVFCFGQEASSKIDSLKLELKENQTNKEKLEILERLLQELLDDKNSNDTKEYYYLFAELSRKEKDPNLERLSYFYLSNYYLNGADFSKSEEYALLSLKNIDSINNKEPFFRYINQLGRVYHHFQQDDKAMDTFLRGINNSDNEHSKYLSMIYSNLGSSYARKGDYEKQIELILKSIKISEKIDDMDGYYYGVYLLGYIYMRIEQYDKAESHYLSVLNDSLKLSEKRTIYSTHAGLGLNYSRWGKHDLALKHNYIALDYFSKTDKIYELEVLNNMSAFYNRMDKYSKATEYAEKVLSKAESVGNKAYVISAKASLSAAYLKSKDFKKAEILLFDLLKDTASSLMTVNEKSMTFQNLAYYYNEMNDCENATKWYFKHIHINDSLLKAQRDSNIATLETKYQTEKKENENLQLRHLKAEQALLLEKENRSKWIFGGGLAASMVVLGVTGFYYRRNQRQKRVIENLQKELHHRIKNNLAIIDAFIDVAKEEFPDKKFKHKLSELQSRIESINEVHRQLYQSKDITSLNIKKYIATLAENVSQSFSAKGIDVEVKIPDSLQMSADKSFPVGLIVNEFFTNSFKYAFDDGKGKINISIDEKDKAYTIALSDNGKGLPQDFDIEKTESFGLRIMKLLTKQLKGSFDLRSENGVKINVKFVDK